MLTTIIQKMSDKLKTCPAPVFWQSICFTKSLDINIVLYSIIFVKRRNFKNDIPQSNLLRGISFLIMNQNSCNEYCYSPLPIVLQQERDSGS